MLLDVSWNIDGVGCQLVHHTNSLKEQSVWSYQLIQKKRTRQSLTTIHGENSQKTRKKRECPQLDNGNLRFIHLLLYFRCLLCYELGLSHILKVHKLSFKAGN